MAEQFELVVVQQQAVRTNVMRDLSSFGSGYTVVKLDEPETSDEIVDLVFTALARNQALERAEANWVVYLDARVALHGHWLDSLRADLIEADTLGAMISVADDGSVWEGGRRADIAYRRDFLAAVGGFPLGVDVAGQEDLLLGLECLRRSEPLLRGRRRSERFRGL